LLLSNASDDEISASPEKIREALTSMQFAAVTTCEHKLFIKSKSTPLAKKIFKVLKLPLPTNINTNKDLSKLYSIIFTPQTLQMSLF